MDLGPIEERANEFSTWVGKFDSANRIPAAFASAADVLRLVEEVKRLTARPAPAWDEDAIRAARDEYVRHNLGMAVGTYGDRLRCAFEAGVDAVRDHLPAWDEDAAALAVFERSHEPSFEDSEAGMREAREFVRALVRDHLHVKPSREDMVEAMLGSDIITDDLRAEASAQGSTQREPFLCFADAVLSLLPGRSEAEVKAEAWDEGAIFGIRDQHGTVDTYIRDAIERHNPYRAAEGGADRG